MNKKILKSIKTNSPNIEAILQISIAVVLYIITLFLMYPTYTQELDIPKVGELATRPLILRHTVKYKNVEETDKLIRYLQADVRPIFEMPSYIKTDTLSQVSNLFSFFYTYDKEINNIDTMYQVFTKEYNFSLSKEVFSNAVIENLDINFQSKVIDILDDLFSIGILSRKNLNPDTLNLILNNGMFVYKIDGAITSEKIVPKNRILFLEDLRQEIDSIVASKYRDMGVFYIRTLSDLIRIFLRDNLIYNAVKTKEKLESIELNTTPIYTTINSGYKVLDVGERVTEDKAELVRYILKDNNFFSYNVLSLLGQNIFTLLVFVSLGYIIFRYKVSFYTNLKNFILVSLEYLFIVSLVFIFKNYINDNLLKTYIPFYAFTFIPMFSMINSLLGARKGISVILTLSVIVLAANIANASLFEVFTLFIISTLTSISAKKISSRNNVFLLGIQIGLSYVLFTFIDLLLSNQLHFDYITYLVVFFSGILQSILVFILLPVCEYFLETSSIFKLQELADLNNPILKQLQINAPGTYHHSIQMANIVETIAEEIGEDGRLARVSAYYHDIGKMENPLYFIENTSKEDNRHNKLKPTLSASIIKSHIKFGVELAKKHRLPKEIIAAIKEHHGSSLIKYFYIEALKENPNVDVNLFTYPGPRPQSKITAILMILDSVEAASRTLDIPTRENLEKLIEHIVADKMNQGELNDSGLTLKDIETIKRISFQKIITSLHERIKYPELPEDKNKEEKEENKASDNKLKSKKLKIKKVAMKHKGSEDNKKDLKYDNKKDNKNIIVRH